MFILNIKSLRLLVGKKRKPNMIKKSCQLSQGDLRENQRRIVDHVKHLKYLTGSSKSSLASKQDSYLHVRPPFSLITSILRGKIIGSKA